MTIEASLAHKFIEQIAQYTNYNINIMNENGVIVASRDLERVGTFHAVAYRVITGMEDVVSVEGEHDYPGVKRGINMVINVDGKRVGVVGISGDPDEIKPIALITKMAVEAMLKYELQQDSLIHRQYSKERFAELLTTEEYADPSRLKSVAHELEYSESVIRIPILLRTREDQPAQLLRILKSDSRHSKQDISFVLDEQRMLVFKVMPEKNLLQDYKFIVADYLSKVLKWLRLNEKHFKVYVGSFQNSFTQYYYGYRHCKWLEQLTFQSTAAFFYDYAGEYYRTMIPMNELQRAFHIHDHALTAETKEEFVEIMRALKTNNYNLTEAARSLYMHKNTFLYRYTKMKTALNINPIQSALDRDFAEAFLNFLIREH